MSCVWWRDHFSAANLGARERTVPNYFCKVYIYLFIKIIRRPTNTLLRHSHFSLLTLASSIVGRALHYIEAPHVQFLWQQSGASDCNQERQHTLANRCSLSFAVSSALCCWSGSLFLRSLSCHTASAQVLGELSMMRTTARADCK